MLGFIGLLIGAVGFIGGGIQEASWNAESKAEAIADGKDTYMDYHGKRRYVKTDEITWRDYRNGHNVLINASTGKLIKDLDADKDRKEKK